MILSRVKWWSVEQWVAATLLSALFVLLFFSISFRFFLGIAFDWVEELSRFMFVWAVYLGASSAVSKGKHIRVHMILNYLPASWRWHAELLGDLTWLFFSVLIFWEGLYLELSFVAAPYEATTLRVSMAWFYSIIPLAFGLMAIRLAYDLLSGRRWQGENPV